jgi:hypothetical protein
MRCGIRNLLNNNGATKMMKRITANISTGLVRGRWKYSNRLAHMATEVYSICFYLLK